MMTIATMIDKHNSEARSIPILIWFDLFFGSIITDPTKRLKI